MGKEWNTQQIEIARLLAEKKTAKQISEQLHCSERLVYDIKKSLKKGDMPLSLMDDGAEAINTEGVQTEEPNIEEVPQKGQKGKKTKASTGKTMQETKSTSLSSFIMLTPQFQQVILTPCIFQSYMCAVKKGFRGDIGAWIDVCCDDFWSGRKINFYEEVSGAVPG